MNNVIVMLIFGMLTYVIIIQNRNIITQSQIIEKNTIQQKQIQRQVQRQPRNKINIHTRNMEHYRQIGILSSNKGIILPLLGRKTHTSSHKWNYYTLTNDAMPIKIPIVRNNKQCMDSNGCDEIYDNDSIRINELNDVFQVTIYDLDPIQYIPYV